MNKRLVTIFLSLAIAAVPAFAGIVNVDFGEMGLNTAVLASPTTPNVSQVVTRLNFSYVDGVTEEVDLSSTGIVGIVDLQDPTATLSGDLVILFPYAVTGLRFTFFVDGTPTEGNPNNLAAFFSPVDFLSSSIVSNPDGTSTFSYGSAFGGTAVDPFSRVDLYFGNSSTSTLFTVDSMQYDYTPEPVSFLLMGTGLVGLGCFRRLRRRS